MLFESEEIFWAGKLFPNRESSGKPSRRREASSTKNEREVLIRRVLPFITEFIRKGAHLAPALTVACQ